MRFDFRVSGIVSRQREALNGFAVEEQREVWYSVWPLTDEGASNLEYLFFKNFPYLQRKATKLGFTLTPRSAVAPAAG